MPELAHVGEIEQARIATEFFAQVRDGPFALCKKLVPVVEDGDGLHAIDGGLDGHGGRGATSAQQGHLLAHVGHTRIVQRHHVALAITDVPGQHAIVVDDDVDGPGHLGRGGQLVQVGAHRPLERHGEVAAPELHRPAHVLNLAQTTVSKRVAVLEESLGVKLLQRTTRTVKVTDEGTKVFQWAQKILDAVSDMQEDLALDQGDLKGPIRVSASARLGRDFVAPALSRMKRRFPGLDVWLELMDRRVDLMGESLHLDVRSGNAEEPHVIGHRIAASSRVLCAAPAYLQKNGAPQSLADLGQHPCLLYRDRGIGADWFVAKSLANGQLERVLPDWQQPVDVWAISTVRTDQSVKVRLLVEYLKAEMNTICRIPA